MKNILIISYGKLIINGTAGNIVMCGLVDSLSKLDFKIHYLGLLSPKEQENSNEIKFQFEKINNINIQSISYTKKKPKNIFGKILSLLDNSRLENVEPFHLTEEFETVIAFDTIAIKLLDEINSPKTLIILGDPPSSRIYHTVLQRYQYTRPIKLILPILLNVIEPIYWRNKIKKIKQTKKVQVGMFGTGHAKDWSKKLKMSVFDLRPFIPNNHPLPTTSLRSGLKICFGGSLAGTASMLTLQFFKTFLMELSKINPTNLEFHIVGECPTEFKEIFLSYNFVKIAGRVEVFEEFLSDMDIFLLPMKYPVGVRTRLCSALQAGCFCICDASVLFNMPELKKCQNIIFLRTESEFLGKITEFIENKNFSREISNTFFNENYNSKISTNKIVDFIKDK